VARRSTISSLLVTACAVAPEAGDTDRLSSGRLLAGDPARGAVLGRKLCVSCHGIRGDGRGPAAGGLEPAPRDFTRAVYRYRSTPSGSLPTDADLARTIWRGLPGSDMPAFGAFLDAQDLLDLVAWVKSFSSRFEEEEVDPPVEIPPPPAMTDKTIARGRVLYEELQCVKCHGEDGSGRGSAPVDELRDALGRVVAPRDFTRGLYKSGRTQRDLYRTFVTGLDGSPMPSYAASMEADDVYALVHYLLDLERGRGLWDWLSEAPTWFEPSEQRVRRSSEG
jgi:cytochrome c oxidase cbb3-type subunit 2